MTRWLRYHSNSGFTYCKPSFKLFPMHQLVYALLLLVQLNKTLSMCRRCQRRRFYRSWASRKVIKDTQSIAQSPLSRDKLTNVARYLSKNSR